MSGMSARVRAGGLVLVLGVVLSGCSEGERRAESPGPSSEASSQPRASTHPSEAQARQLLRSALDAAEEAQSVRAQVKVIASTGPFTQDIRVVPHGGVQKLSGLAGNVEIRVIEDVAFIQGDPVALQAYFGFSPAGALKTKGRWISYTPESPRHLEIAAATTLELLVDQLRIEAPLRLGESKSEGGKELASVVGLPQGNKVPEGASATLWVEPESGLPTRLEVVSSAASYTIDLSEWNAPVQVAAPERPVQIEQLAAEPDS